MNIFARIWRLIKGWLLIGVEKAEDPDVILAEAQDSMRRELEKAKEAAVQAIAARNQLTGVISDEKKLIANLEVKARAALQQGDEELARTLLVEKSAHDQNVENLSAQLEKAEAASVAVKQGIKTLEQNVRQRAAQALALKAGWKQAQIQEQLNKALSGISMDSQNEAFSRAEEKIRNIQAQADARLELGSETNMNAKIAKLDDVISSNKADEALERMKAEMGMSTASTVASSDPLEKLKAEINGSKQQEQVMVRNLEV